MSTASLRVGLLIDRFDPRRGGAERALADLAEALAARGHDVRVFAASAAAGSLPPRARLERVPRIGLTRTARERRFARAVVERAEAACDVTVGVRHLERVGVYWPHGGSHRAALDARRRSRGRSPEPEPRGRHALFLELERALLDRGGARLVACVSDAVRDELAAAYPAAEERLVVVRNGVDLARFDPRERVAVGGSGAALRARLGVADDLPLLSFCAREPRLKGLPVLLDALAGLSNLRWGLLAAGMRDPRAWREEARRRGLAARAHFLPEVDGAALAAAADLAVVPTWRDTCSLVLLEALAAGTPVVTTHAAGAADLVDDEVGAVVEPGDAAGLGRALRARLALGQPTPERRAAIRRRVASCGREPWLERMLELVLRAAGE